MKCEKCGKEMSMEDKDTSSGRDMRTYRCDHCRKHSSWITGSRSGKHSLTRVNPTSDGVVLVPYLDG